MLTQLCWEPEWSPFGGQVWGPLGCDTLHTCTHSKHNSETCLTKNGKRALEFNSFGTMPEDPNTLQQIPTDSLTLKGLASLAERPRQGSRSWDILSCVELHCASLSCIQLYSAELSCIELCWAALSYIANKSYVHQLFTSNMHLTYPMSNHCLQVTCI